MLISSRTEPIDATRPLMVTAEELAGELQISERTLWRLLSSGQLIEPIRIGRSVRWRREEVERWIANSCPPRDKWESSNA
jgi:excisionase family DNA binding protein